MSKRSARNRKHLSRRMAGASQEKEIQDAIEYLMVRCGVFVDRKDLNTSRDFLETLQRAVEEALNNLQGELTDPDEDEVETLGWDRAQLQDYLNRERSFDCSDVLAFELWDDLRISNLRKSMAEEEKGKRNATHERNISTEEAGIYAS